MKSETWSLTEHDFDPDLIPRNETLFALSNGYIGLRGDFEEGEGNFHPGTYINGFYEIRPIEYGEWGYGFAKFHQTIQNTANPRLVRTRVNGNLIGVTRENCHEYRRRLDFRNGTLERSMLTELPSRERVRYESRRFVSLTDPHLSVLEIAVTPLDADSTIVFESYIDGTTTNRIDFGDPRVSSHHERSKEISAYLREGNAVGLAERTRLSRIAAATCITHNANLSPHEMVALPDDAQPGTATGYRVEQGTTLRFRKYAYSSLVDEGNEEELVTLMSRLRSAADRGFDELLSEHRAELDSFWQVSDIVIEGNDEVQRKVRYSLFQLFMAGRFLIDNSVPAKGLTSEGYEGHFFWDTEIFIMPFFAFTRSACAREILRHRCRMLDAARARAREMAERGALFPWRTINGQEASAFFLAGTAQYHINAAVAYAIRQYAGVTGDYQFLLDEGAEVLFETARSWLSLGFFNKERGGKFCINGVTGPDEYTALVNNNCYTNMMARFHLNYAVEVYYWMAAEYFEELQRVSGKLGLKPDEVDEWRDAAEKMHIPYDQARGVYLQDDEFLSRQPWDFEGTPKEKYPLLLNFHPLVIYRHQVLKQPDMLMAAFLLPEEFTDGDHMRAYEFYTPLTTFDSSLGAPVQTVLSARQGHLKEAWKFFIRNLDVDLEDIQGNVRDGLHMAATGGTWQALVFGFGGLKMEGSIPRFEPHLPDEIERLRFKIRLRGSLLSVRFDRREITYAVEEGAVLQVCHDYEVVTIEPGKKVKRSLVPEFKGLLIHLPSKPKDAVKGFKPLLETLRSLGVRTILCAAEEGHPLIPHVDQYSSSEMIVKNIPDPEPFYTGATMAELALRDCLVLTAGVNGSEAASRGGFGCHCLEEIGPASIPTAADLQAAFEEHNRR
jgi:trehalose/maltose hydrolase-like predicted phosphorylase